MKKINVPISIIFKAAKLFFFLQNHHALQYTSAKAALVFEIHP